MAYNTARFVELLRTTDTADLRSRVFLAAEEILLVDVHGAGFTIHGGDHLVVVTLDDPHKWGLDDLLEVAELYMHNSHAHSSWGEGDEPPTVTMDDIRVRRRPPFIDNTLPF